MYSPINMSSTGISQSSMASLLFVLFCLTISFLPESSAELALGRDLIVPVGEDETDRLDLVGEEAGDIRWW